MLHPSARSDAYAMAWKFRALVGGLDACATRKDFGAAEVVRLLLGQGLPAGPFGIAVGYV